MNDPRGVGLGESVGNLRADLEELAGGHRLLNDEVPQRPPLDDLHRDVDHSVRGADVVDSDDVGVVQRRGRARLLLEALAPLRVQRNLGGKDLDRDFPPEPGVTGPIHLSHPARAERREHLIRTQAGPRRKAHLSPKSKIQNPKSLESLRDIEVRKDTDVRVGIGRGVRGHHDSLDRDDSGRV